MKNGETLFKRIKTGVIKLIEVIMFLSSISFGAWYLFNSIVVNKEISEQHFRYSNGYALIEKSIIKRFDNKGLLLSPIKIIEYKELKDKIINIRSKEAKDLEWEMSEVVDRFYLCGGTKSTFDNILSQCNYEDMKLHNKSYSKHTPYVYGNRINFLTKNNLLSKDDVEIEVMEDIIKRYKWIMTKAKEINLKNAEIDKKERIEAEKQTWIDGREERLENDLKEAINKIDLLTKDITQLKNK